MFLTTERAIIRYDEAAHNTTQAHKSNKYYKNRTYLKVIT